MFLSPFQKCGLREAALILLENIDDIIKKVMTHYSVTTKDNKRNGIELWRGRIGLNMRKDFLIAEVIKHLKEKLEIREALWSLLPSRIA